VQAQCPEPHCIFGVVFAPFVGIIFEGLQQRIVSICEPAIGDRLGDTLGFTVAKIRCLQDGADRALGGNRVLANEFPIADQHAAEILRPRTVQGRIELGAAAMGERGISRARPDELVCMDSSLEGAGFELLVRGRGEAGCRAS